MNPILFRFEFLRTASWIGIEYSELIYTVLLMLSGQHPTLWLTYSSFMSAADVIERELGRATEA
jgi:hypothetical protein